MCFVTTINTRSKIATEDILCWKTFLRNPAGHYLSAIWGYRYYVGLLQPIVHIIKRRRYPSAKRKNLILQARIDAGYHSYATREEAEYNCDYDEVVRTCVIPKGTKYYYSAEAQEYVSETIKLLRHNPKESQ